MRLRAPAAHALRESALRASIPPQAKKGGDRGAIAPFPRAVGADRLMPWRPFAWIW